MNGEPVTSSCNEQGKPVSVAGLRPFDQQYVVVTKLEFIQLRHDGNYWKNQFARGKMREAALQQQIKDLKIRATKQIEELRDQANKQIQELQTQASELQIRAREREAALLEENKQLLARIRDLNHRLFGKSSESSRTGSKPPLKQPTAEPRRRGQQPGQPGHGRTPRPDLPEVTEERALPEGADRCPCCGLPYVLLESTEDSQLIEIEVKTHRRIIRRQRYRRSCQCGGLPAVITAPPAPRLFPRTQFGVSVWAFVALSKYLYGLPLHRIRAQLAARNLPVSAGTLDGGLQQLLPLLMPLAHALRARLELEPLVHGDETRWPVFIAGPGARPGRWYLWVLCTKQLVCCIVAPSRGHQVLVHFMQQLQQNGVERLIFVCDRYGAYVALSKRFQFLLLAFCWAHVRRDFLNDARSFPELQEWMFSWVARIAQLYQLNGRRLQHWDPQQPLSNQSPEFAAAHQELCQALAQMEEARGQQLSANLHKAQRKRMKSLVTYWSGLTVFRDHPQVPMDNNSAEQTARPAAVGRKIYYGAGSIWSAWLAAHLFSLLPTISRWGLNTERWLQSYFEACAAAGGKPPADLSPFLPWEMDEARRRELGGREPLPALPPPGPG